jgi:5-methylcytosine-specific restriction protein A
VLVNGRDSKCPIHIQVQRKRENGNRDKAITALYGAAWRKARAHFLRAHPLCMCDACRSAGLVVPASVVDHVTPHRGDVRLFWDRENWQSLSKPCHDRKTAREDGGFGRESKHGANGDADRT